MKRDWIDTFARPTARRAPALLRLGLALMAGAVASGCDVHSETAPGSLVSIVVTPNVTLFPLGTQQMVAVGYDAEGKVVPITPTWSVVSGDGVVTAAGLYTAGSTVGTFGDAVQANVGDVAGASTVTVVTGPVASLTIAPATTTTLGIGGSQQFVASAKDIGGNTVLVTPVWSVEAGGGTITQTGVFTASSIPGNFINTVKATANGQSAFVSVTVLAGALSTLTVTPNSIGLTVGGSQQFTVVGKDASGNVLPISPTWSVVGGGGTISSTGLFTAGSTPGTFTNTVNASVGVITGRASVTVSSGTLATITVSPNAVSMIAGGVQQFSAVGKDAAGNVLTIVPVWSIVSVGSGASITQDGLYTAGPAAGAFANEVIATVGGVSGTASIVINGGLPTNAGFLGTAARFGVLAGGGVSCAASGAVNGPSADVGSSPTNTVTGFPAPCSLTGALVTPGEAAIGQADLATAFASLQTIAGCIDLTGTDLSSYGLLNPLAPGCYSFATAAGLNGTLSLRGTPGSVWTFRVALTLDVGSGSNVLLGGGAIPDNVRWVVGTSASIGAGSHVEGNILAANSISLLVNASLTGRALARTGTVTMNAGGAVVSKP